MKSNYTAKSRNASATMPIAPWDVSPLCESDFDPILPVHRTQNEPVANLAARLFAGDMNRSDMRYVAQAVLQLWDEMHELREHVRRLEARK